MNTITTNPNDTVSPVNENHLATWGTGLTKREHFAAMAMQGILSGATKELAFVDIGVQSVSIANALIAELNK